MVNFTSEDFEEFQKQLKKIKEKSPDKEMKFIEFLNSEESMESMKLFYKVYFENRDDTLSDEEWGELMREFETKLLFSNIKFGSYFHKGDD